MRPWTSVRPDPRGNLLLAALTESDRNALAADLEPVALDYREVIYHPHEPLSHVYFPLSGLISLVVTSRGGGTVEVGPVGRDGMLGLPVFLGAATDPLEAFAQIVPCLAFRIPSATFAEAAERLPSLQKVMRLYVQWTYFGMAQWVLCARLHPAEERMARWLLMCQDRVAQDSFPLTHEFLAQMLGVRRATVTLAAGTLHQSGLVAYRRGLVSILDRQAMEQATCECYPVSTDEYRRLFGRSLA